MKTDDDPTAGAYERGDVTLSRFRDACPACVHSRPSGTSYLCALKEMRVFADTTCKDFGARSDAQETVALSMRLALYRANLGTEPGVAEHEEVRVRVAAANAGRTG